jgi:hypothetical protein
MQVERTLVKSPPELWAEVSEVESLAKHLAEFGEIKITRVEPETTVAWEGEHASGTVELTASGWGTKVTLTAALATPAEIAPPEDVAPEAVAEPEPVAETAAPEPELVVEPEPEPEPVAEIPGPPAPPMPDPTPPTPTPEPGPAPPLDPNPPQIRLDPDRTQAVLTQVLDDLGQAHHRPFSRS